MDQEFLKNALPDPVFVLPTIDSTNTEARRRAFAGQALPFFLLTDHQTDGRGRMGRSFFSPKGTGIYLSYAFEPVEGGADALWLTTAAAVAVRRAVEAVTGIVCDIKWVNDLYVGDHKVCGILAESCFVQGRQTVILGVGINLYTEIFPEELSGVAGALMPKEPNLHTPLAAEVCRRLRELNEQPDRAAIMDDYRAHSMVLGRSIVYTEHGVTYEGIADSVDERGRLTVLRTDGVQSILAAGEITLRIRRKEST